MSLRTIQTVRPMMYKSSHGDQQDIEELQELIERCAPQKVPGWRYSIPKTAFRSQRLLADRNGFDVPPDQVDYEFRCKIDGNNCVARFIKQRQYGSFPSRKVSSRS